MSVGVSGLLHNVMYNACWTRMRTVGVNGIPQERWSGYAPYYKDRYHVSISRLGNYLFVCPFRLG